MWKKVWWYVQPLRYIYQFSVLYRRPDRHNSHINIALQNAVPMTLSDLERWDTMRQFFFWRISVKYARTVWSRTTKLGMVTRGGGHVSRGRPWPPSQGGSAPASPKFLGPLCTWQDSHQILLCGDQTGWQENFYEVDHAPLPWPEVFVTRM